jgi:hypothetical protein
LEDNRGTGKDLEGRSHYLIKGLSEQMFHTGYAYADPHPGNGKKARHCVEAIIVPVQKALKMNCKVR